MVGCAFILELTPPLSSPPARAGAVESQLVGRVPCGCPSLCTSQATPPRPTAPGLFYPAMVILTPPIHSRDRDDRPPKHEPDTPWGGGSHGTTSTPAAGVTPQGTSPTPTAGDTLQGTSPTPAAGDTPQGTTRTPAASESDAAPIASSFGALPTPAAGDTPEGATTIQSDATPIAGSCRHCERQVQSW